MKVWLEKFEHYEFYKGILQILFYLFFHSGKWKVEKVFFFHIRHYQNYIYRLIPGEYDKLKSIILISMIKLHSKIYSVDMIVNSIHLFSIFVLHISSQDYKLRKSAKPEGPTDFQCLLDAACFSKDISQVKMLLDYRHIHLNFRDQQGYTPLMVAASEGFSECVHALTLSSTRVSYFTS